jgi:hypothetical protein
LHLKDFPDLSGSHNITNTLVLATLELSYEFSEGQWRLTCDGSNVRVQVEVGLVTAVVVAKWLSLVESFKPKLFPQVDVVATVPMTGKSRC